MCGEDLPPGIEGLGLTGSGSLIIRAFSRTYVTTLMELLHTEDASIHCSLDANLIGSHA